MIVFERDSRMQARVDECQRARARVGALDVLVLLATGRVARVIAPADGLLPATWLLSPVPRVASHVRGVATGEVERDGYWLRFKAYAGWSRVGMIVDYYRGAEA